MVAMKMVCSETFHISNCFCLNRCGTDIRNTAEIGPVTIGKVENKGRQNRRINIAFA
jgi:misacylated tRNA(Ala) deacylase